MAANKERQQAVLDFWIANPFATYSDICKATGVSDSAFARWRKDEEFMSEYHKRTESRFCEMELRAMAQLEKLVSKGEWQAVKYVLDGNGYNATQKLDVDANTTIVIGVEDEPQCRK